MCVVFVQEVPEVELDASGASIVYRSGGQAYPRRMPRSLWRRFLESEIRRLNAWEREHRSEVVAMGKRLAH